MKLADWFAARNADGSKRSKKDFAQAIGRAPSSVTAYLNGVWPSKEVMEAIDRVTNGEVTANDFLSSETQRALEAAE